VLTIGLFAHIATRGSILSSRVWLTGIVGTRMLDR
jgi:hypothetical protein